MSADATVQRDDGQTWIGIHDGPCKQEHRGTVYELGDVLLSVEDCFGQPLNWNFVTLENGKTRLRGWMARSG